MSDWSLYIAVTANLAVAGQYAVIALLLVPRWRLPLWARLGGAAFFALCAYTYLQLALHTVDLDGGVRRWLVSLPMVIPLVVQTIAGWAFILASSHLQIVWLRSPEK